MTYYDNGAYREFRVWMFRDLWAQRKNLVFKIFLAYAWRACAVDLIRPRVAAAKLVFFVFKEFKFRTRYAYVNKRSNVGES